MYFLFNLFLNILFFKIVLTAMSRDAAIQYLQQYGYLNDSNQSLSMLEDALVKFQEDNNLVADGTFNNETISLMERPRCGVKDGPFPYSTFQIKWNKTNLLWHFPLATSDQKIVAEKAFGDWQKISALTFTYSRINPDILIIMPDEQLLDHQHSDRCQTGNCTSRFDGRGGVLAHAYPPTSPNSCREIHFDPSEHFYYGLDDKTQGNTSLYAVLLHEIGHTLGLAHTNKSRSVMGRFYSGLINFSADDIDGIQHLYGKPTNIQASANTSKTRSASATPHPVQPNLCDLKYVDNMLVTSDHYLYIFYKEWVWSIKLGEKKITATYNIRNYLPSFTSFSHIIQKTNNEILIIKNNTYSILEYPSLNRRYSFRSLTELHVPQNARLTNIFQTYTGKTIVFFTSGLRHHHYVFFDDSGAALQRGLAEELYPGIPANISSTFRYINGNLYFFSGSTYEYNEFLNKVVSAGDFHLRLFGLDCRKEDTIEEIRRLVCV